MPTIIRKSESHLLETRRETHISTTWHVRSNVWRPATDVYETETGVVVRVEIAGLREEDIEVVIQGELLLISGNRSDLPERRAYHQMEIPFGRFTVSVVMPASIVIEGAFTDYQDGFLTIHFPKDK
ncbi:MAG TPA: hypothetical protein DCX53_10620 [Anaerolineae bacterium]|nr:hypothetical protein [Anaerolineae bacterium]